MSIHKSKYLENLADEMRSAGQDNWLQYDMHDLCEMAGLYDDWLNTTNRFEKVKLTLKAANILGVEIRHYIEMNEFQKMNCDDCACNKCLSVFCVDCVRCYRAEYAESDWVDYYRKECEDILD